MEEAGQRLGNAYDLLLRYQLLEKGKVDLVGVYEIQERYQRFREYIKSSTLLANRIINVLNACETIENAIRDEVQRVQEFRESLGNDEFDKHYKKIIDDEDKEIVAQVGQPLPPCPEIESHPVLLEVYRKHGARTWTQKSNALEKEMGSRPGGFNVHARGMWREPNWKNKQFKFRALAYLYLMERKLIK